MTRHLVIVLAMLGLGLPAMAHAQSARAQLEDAQAKVCRDRNAQRSPRRRARQPPGERAQAGRARVPALGGRSALVVEAPRPLVVDSLPSEIGRKPFAGASVSRDSVISHTPARTASVRHRISTPLTIAAIVSGAPIDAPLQQVAGRQSDRVSTRLFETQGELTDS